MSLSDDKLRSVGEKPILESQLDGEVLVALLGLPADSLVTGAVVVEEFTLTGETDDEEVLDDGGGGRLLVNDEILSQEIDLFTNSLNCSINQ